MLPNTNSILLTIAAGYPRALMSSEVLGSSYARSKEPSARSLGHLYIPGRRPDTNTALSSVSQRTLKSHALTCVLMYTPDTCTCAR